PTVSISTWDPGWYLVSCLFEHKYGLGQSSEKINDELNNWFKLEHIITVSKPIVNLSDNKTKILDITDVTAWCSKPQIGTIENLEASNHSYEVYRLSTKKLEFNGVLEWSITNNSWHSKNVNVSELGPGNYFIICKFSITGIGSGESIHSPGDQTEFTISGVSDDRNNDGDDGTISDEYLIIIVLVVIIIIILLFIMIFIRIRKTF
ncbi:MAG: hypothetical protein KAJ51_14730, partial [Thermoplasmata archaeon]|nr:hypothetical protein [Thermoplasmata archaeon]